MTIHRIIIFTLTILGAMLLVTTASPQSGQTGCRPTYDKQPDSDGWGTGWTNTHIPLCSKNPASGASCRWYTDPYCVPPDYEVCFGYSDPEGFDPPETWTPILVAYYGGPPIPVPCGQSIIMTVYCDPAADSVHVAAICTPPALCSGTTERDKGTRDMNTWNAGLPTATGEVSVGPCVCAP
jgi:hypothetical protein